MDDIDLTETYRAIPMSRALWEALADRARQNGRRVGREAQAIIRRALGVKEGAAR